METRQAPSLYPDRQCGRGKAEAVAFAVLTHYGMQPQSRFYLAGYGITGDMLTASMQTIAATARQIIERIEGHTDEQEADAEASPLPLTA